MSDIQELLDKQAIREAIMRYARGVDRGDAELICSAYHPDAYDDHSGKEYTGESVGPELVASLATTRVAMHHLTNQVITLHGDNRAGAETYFTVWQSQEVDGQEAMLHALGRYIDHFECRNGEWRIARRLVIVEDTYIRPPGLPTPSSKLGIGTRDGKDPSYEACGG